MLPDNELLAQYLDGDDEAFPIFYGRYRKVLYVYILSLVGRREVAEELLQDVFLRFLKRLWRQSEELLSTRSSFRPYLFRAARNRAFDQLRARGRRPDLDRPSDPWFQDSYGEGGGFGDSEGLGAGPVSHGLASPIELQELIDRLPDEQREAIVLRAVAGLTFRQIGEMTGVTENTAVSRYRYALAKLRVPYCDDDSGCNDNTGANFVSGDGDVGPASESNDVRPESRSTGSSGGRK